MRALRLIPVGGVALSLLVFAACSTKDSRPPAAGSSSGAPETPGSGAGQPTGDAGGDASGDAAGDGGIDHGCTTFLDGKGDASIRQLTWDLTIASAPERCLKVAVGDTVTWQGNLSTHPLTVDGVTPGDIRLGTGQADVTFAAAGTYPFQCLTHPTMKGAILVE